MENEGNLSVKDMFSGDLGSLTARFSGIEAEHAVSVLKGAFLEKVTGIKWDQVFSEAAESAKRLLDIKIEDILAGAWKKHREIKRYADRKKYPPEETILCPLSRHHVKSVHHPALEIFIDDESVGKIIFDLVLGFDLEGITLKIRDARIMEILAGKCSGSGSLKYGDVVFLEKKSDKIPIPGSVSLGKGIPIKGM